MIEEFKSLPELADDQIDEINDYFTPYIFYQRKKIKRPGIAGVEYTNTVYECTCTHCNTTYTHSFEGGPKHNDKVTCPKCHTNAFLKHVSRGKKNLRETQRVILFCPKSENEVWLRAFYATKTYNGDPHGNKSLNSLYTKADEELTPEVELSETARYLLKPGSARCWKFDYSYYGTHTWNEVNPREPFNSNMGHKDYWILSEDLTKDTFLKYLDLDEYHKAARDFSYSYIYRYGPINTYTTRYICEFAKYPIMESLLKSGFGELIGEKIFLRTPHKRLLNWEASKISDFFRTFNKTEIQTLRQEDYQVIFLKAYSAYKTVSAKPGFNVLREDLKKYGSDEFISLCKFVRKYKLNFTKAINYLSKQNSKNPQNDIGVWRDYLDFASRLKYDLKNEVVLYPKNLHTAHDQASTLVTAMAREAEASRMKKLTDKLKDKYSFTYRGLQIVVPEAMQDIIDEFDMKAESVACFIKNLKAEVEMIKNEERALKTRRENKERQFKRLNEYLISCLDKIGCTKIETSKAVVSIRNNAESLVVDDEISFIKWLQENNDELLKYSMPEIRKAEVKKLYKTGVQFPFVHTERSRSLIIK